MILTNKFIQYTTIIQNKILFFIHAFILICFCPTLIIDNPKKKSDDRNKETII
jgi:large-conductance mechanosensitive channel